MTSTFLMILAGCAAMALTQAALGALFPASHRPWWHALPRAARPIRSTAGASSELPTVPADSDELLQSPSLTVVETVDRRHQSLPFVGRDRRLVAQIEAAETSRRTGTRD
ncbi:hypothetical protein [Sphaerotilus mobilis]|uniref:Uncharacterized protein n=1 Tax=Sphaerotilus mobilis TaxID=47994 RepID=A0A4Q7LJQ7_9BURK|nr:hypothetical protein [Sphaerotilus mobilis]RZS54855.1 hypothetical protein EV685_2340 [Sphaerotilus mobilis]